MTHDKWDLVDHLTVAAADFDLSHRSIAVLRVMLTFVPDRHLTPLPGRAIVFASNATLCARLGGMPESTLRRHLAALVASGVIERCDSPNRKRFAKRLGNGLGCAFGFDVGRLAILAPEIKARAAVAERRAQEHAALRCAVLAARQTLIQHLTAQGIDPEAPGPYSPLFGRTRLFLRRKDNHDDLRLLLSDLENALITPEPSVSDIENERHQHKEIDIDSGQADETVDKSPLGMSKTIPQIDLNTFKEYRLMFPKEAETTDELNSHARQLIPMMGIDLPVYDEALELMGMHLAPLAVLGMLERFETLKNPGGYLRHLSQQARRGSLDVSAMLDHQTARLSADNLFGREAIG